MIRRSDISPRPTLGRRGRIAGVALALTATLGVALPACGGGGSDANGSAYKVRAIFDSAAFIIGGLDVKIGGVRVGQVLDVELTEDNQAAVTFAITDPGFQDMREDGSCGIRPQALIGERYLQCTLTEPRPDGASPPPPLPEIQSGKYKGEHLLPATNTWVPVDSDLLLNTSTLSARERLGIIIRELGVGLEGRGDKLAVALDKGNDALVLTNRILKQLASQTETLKQLTSSSDQVLASLATERAALTGTIENGATVSSTLASQRENLAASIASLNRLLDEVGPSADKALELTDELAPIAADLNKSAGDLATVLNDLPDLASEGEDAIVALGPTADLGRKVLTSSDMSDTIDRFGKAAAVLSTTGRTLGATLGDLRTTGGLDYLLDAIYGVAYATNGRDANGAFLRAAALGNASCFNPNAMSATTACGTRLSGQQSGRLSSADRAAGSTEDGPGKTTDSSAKKSSAAASASPAETEAEAAGRLLFGGSR